MPKTWQPHEAKRFARELKLNQPYYVVLDITHAKVTAWGEDQLYSEHTFTGRLPLTGSPCTESGYSAVDICRLQGPVYDAPPRGMHNVADKPPQDFKPGRNHGGRIADWV